MARAGLSVARISFLGLVASMLGAAMLASPAVGSTSACPSSGKCFAVAVSPSNLAAGTSASFTFTITNEASTQQLGSVKISAPAGFVITGGSGAANFTSSSALFLNLSLAPWASTTVTLTASASCSGGGYQWGIEAKQSNDFNGSGNDFQLDPNSAGNLSGTLTGSCSLAFTSDGQPTNTAADAVITSQGGGPVKVEVLNGSGQLATASSAVISIGLNPGSVTLSGTVMVPASGGIASFSDLKINQPGFPYTLTATSPGIAPVTSNAFAIGGSSCPSGTSCSASASSMTTSGTAMTLSPVPGDVIATGIVDVSDASYSCGTYKPVSDAFSFALFNAAGMPQSDTLAVSLEIDKSLVQPSTHPGASSWQICYASTSQFTAVPGTTGTTTIGGITYHTGLLLDCPAPQGQPCVQARHKDNAGDVVITFLAPGDPVVKG
jgi:hypothetical protein